jgi:hypothetical protein
VSHTDRSQKVLIQSTQDISIGQQRLRDDFTGGFARTEERIELLSTRSEDLCQFNTLQSMIGVQLRSQQQLESKFELILQAQEKEPQVEPPSRQQTSRPVSANRVNRSTIAITGRHFHSCSIFCDCICHKTSRFQTPQLLNQVLGSLSVNYRGSIRGTKCSNTLCRRRSPFSARSKCRLPMSFLKEWFLYAVISAHPPGPLASLSAIRVRGGHEVFDMIMYGDIPGVQKIFALGEASVLDVQGSHQTPTLV